MAGFTFIALGANLPSTSGDPAVTLAAAVDMLARLGVRVKARSGWFSSPAFPAGSGPDYVNGAIAVEWPDSAQSLLELLHRVEQDFGRERVSRWAQRPLDLDLVAHGDEVAPDARTWVHWHDLSPDRQASEAPDRLILPHPRMQDRAFVLKPLARIAPDWRHPVLGRTVTQMLDALPEADRDAVRPI